MLKIILLLVAVMIAGFVIAAATRPADFRLSRATTIAAPPAVVFAQVNDFHRWEAWSPWARLDPNAINSFAGPAEGVGAKFSWAGNHQVGAGNMTILESRPGALVRLKLEFLKPFAATNTTEFTFTPEGGRTVVTWTMTGQNNFMARAFSMFVDCEKLMGPDFEKGLVNLKAVSEAAPKT